MEVANKKWSEDELFQMRKEVLSKWPTGSEVDIEEAIAYHKQIPLGKNMVELNRRARIEGKPYLRKPVGRATVEDQIEHMQALAKTGIDCLEVFADTYTRKSQYEKAQAGLEASRKQELSLLNGFPIVNHGVHKARKIIESIDLPTVIFSAVDEDPRLIHEIGMAAGFTEGAFHSIADLVGHSKNYPLDMRIRNDQYGARLTAYYIEHGAPVSLYGPSGLSGLDPPEMKITLSILQGLLVAEQGVRDLVISLISTVHLIQYVAAVKVLRKLMREYLDRFGYTEVSVTVEAGSWHGAWPLEQYSAAAVDSWDVSIAVLAGVDCIWLKAIGEAAGIPNRESDIASIRIAKKLIDIIGRQRLPESDELSLEEEMMSLAVRAIVNRVIDLGDGDVAIGMIKAVQAGVIDTSISPWTYLARKVLEVRDITGAIRYLDHGNVPLPKQVADYHRQKIAERERADGTKAGIEMFIQDVTYISREVVSEVVSEK